MVYPDLMHLKHLGTDQVLVGSVLTWLAKHFLRGTVKDNLLYVWSFLKKWHKDSCGHMLVTCLRGELAQKMIIVISKFCCNAI